MIISIGEVVWDIFSDRQVLGGAPINVAYHLQNLQMDVNIITRIGDDDLGSTTLAQLENLGLSDKGVQKDPALPTGRVNVTVDADNEPHFDIVAPAAWDAISLEEAEHMVHGKRFHLVFGTLAQRDERSRHAIRSLWNRATLCFYDVNLRPPFTTEDLVFDSLAAADLVKMNGDELMTICRWAGIGTQDKTQSARALLDRYGVSILAVTEGKDGAWLVAGDDFFENTAKPVTIADTVGAGDAFFAALIEGYINGRTWDECLLRANKRGAYVASQNGATPPMPETL